ncbi:hypothetical protein BT96DRAFT_1021495 [Gymnopus androsaceus JB14]|uniref:Uncharacterized protein n=1 Tax=Gymnopus androsaceus JB14 TaxID=1447944 RepID=A0A6A4HEU9_9AGAR|nr:hypothetical protein BT96DRAFT_1021495 [Gymnopus androsaceus JB14]
MSHCKRPARSSNSVLLGITETTPELIAYVAVQLILMDKQVAELTAPFLESCFSDLHSQTKEPTANSKLASLFTQSSVPFDYNSNDARHGDIPDDGDDNDEGNDECDTIQNN